MPKKKSKPEVLIEKETLHPRATNGGGILSYEIWGYSEAGKTIVTRYNLAYLNHLIYQRDNGRVLGYDNAHEYHHKHYMGKVMPVTFISYEKTLDHFQEEWQEIVRGLQRKKK
jgi:hypothetical protein